MNDFIEPPPKWYRTIVNLAVIVVVISVLVPEPFRAGHPALSVLMLIGTSLAVAAYLAKRWSERRTSEGSEPLAWNPLSVATVALSGIVLTALLGVVGYYLTGQKSGDDERIVIQHVLDSPAKGLVVKLGPYATGGEWYTRVVLLGQDQLLRWDIPVSAPDDPKVADVLQRAIQNQDVDAVTLDRVERFVSVPSFVDPKWSFLVRGAVEVCIRNFSTAAVFGQPLESLPERLPGSPTGQAYLDLLKTLESSIRTDHHNK
ncbi:MAG TPA: hypothetical protein VEL77_01465 [Rugosimonospora sp.]|nr:hypothetical protein [Rugosimonospora sp.]